MSLSKSLKKEYWSIIGVKNNLYDISLERMSSKSKIFFQSISSRLNISMIG